MKKGLKLYVINELFVGNSTEVELCAACASEELADKIIQKKLDAVQEENFKNRKFERSETEIWDDDISFSYHLEEIVIDNINTIIELEGGLVQNVYSNLMQNVLVVDKDTEGAEDEEISREEMKEKISPFIYHKANIDSVVYGEELEIEIATEK